ncbi:MAG: DUF1801 domain-containing protein [Rhizomicrobium sp.]|jgi:uncharacterized protein YdhG (YjbR/CyaY superfamily)
MTTFKSVDDYIAAQPQSVRAALERVRGAIRKALPRAEETISYNMPSYKLGGETVIHFAAWKKHFSLYPASEKLLAFFKKDLAAATINKSTIRFAFSEPVPAELIARIAKYRVKELADRAKAKASK